MPREARTVGLPAVRDDGLGPLDGRLEDLARVVLELERADVLGVLVVAAQQVGVALDAARDEAREDVVMRFRGLVLGQPGGGVPVDQDGELLDHHVRGGVLLGQLLAGARQVVGDGRVVAPLPEPVLQVGHLRVGPGPQ